MVAGVIGAGLGGVTIGIPAFNLDEAMTAPNLGLVCGGTSCKQLSSEKCARIIGYGGMLLEGLLALCVILLISGGMEFEKYKSLVYPAGGGSNAPLAFALGLGNILHLSFGLPAVYGTIWGILLLEGFLMLTFTNAYLKIWPIFGAANQLLAALTLIAVTAWLAQKSKKLWYTAIPAGFMVVTTMTSLAILLGRYLEQRNWSLLATDVVLLALGVGVATLTFRYFYRLRRRLAGAPVSGGPGSTA